MGVSLARLISANSGLNFLDVGHCDLRDDGMRPIINALRCNTYLRKLVCSKNGLTPAFAVETLLPALAGNSSLRVLKLDRRVPELARIEALVASRGEGRHDPGLSLGDPRPVRLDEVKHRSSCTII